MSTVLIVGGTRGLGASLASAYAAAGSTVYATCRSPSPPSSPSHDNILWVPAIDIATESAGVALAAALPPHAVLDTVIITAGYFTRESFEEPRWDEEVKMYTTCAVGPLFVVQALITAGKVKTHIKGGVPNDAGKVVLVSSEAGSIGLRHAKEGGGNYAHHASKTALNMVGKLLSLDLLGMGVAVAIVHPGFMRTEMTKNVGYDEFWDSGGAVTPDEAAASLIPFIDAFSLEKTGQFWAPRGSRDIGTAEATMGKDLPTPLPLPW
ncbi:Oxidoreductase, short chain dehydrogenase/reductase family superfamily [Mycena indigotica]|uniref:Oxidoreductase, short chain dehydrogenase/reductase family superfamily n=1 Tax=Mycena indigotica TaxID=2126181 RepID=A0A8H6W835_9AGAR|nr:Oxidoreductase, short chain dehydrogenase/reductase family superfamily [Mycena indigotica]KAF7309284.1 Oxidoreductase, short chain dehydrogenase/reductase family superfamily [Mycena indigotica]